MAANPGRKPTHKSSRHEGAISKEAARGKSFGSKSPLQVKSGAMRQAKRKSRRK